MLHVLGVETLKLFERQSKTKKKEKSQLFPVASPPPSLLLPPVSDWVVKLECFPLGRSARADWTADQLDGEWRRRRRRQLTVRSPQTGTQSTQGRSDRSLSRDKKKKEGKSITAPTSPHQSSSISSSSSSSSYLLLLIATQAPRQQLRYHENHNPSPDPQQIREEVLQK